MPCDQVRTVTVDLNAADMPAFREGLKQLGLNYSEGEVLIIHNPERLSGKLLVAEYNPKTKQLTVTSSAYASEAKKSEFINQIKRAYSTGVVFTQAQKFGWEIKQVQEPLTLKVRA